MVMIIISHMVYNDVHIYIRHIDTKCNRLFIDIWQQAMYKKAKQR